MKIHHEIIQGTPEWFAIRAGRITASEIGPFVCGSGKVADKAKAKLIYKKMAELAGEFEDVFPNDAMKRGTALEPIARREYARITGHEVEEIGFISHESQPLGCSPDGLIGSEGGLEIKCPSASTHISWLLEGGLPDEHKWQVHMSMVLSERRWWSFFSFSPRVTQWTKTREAWVCDEWEPGPLPPLHAVVTWDRFTDDLKAGLEDLCGMYADIKGRMARILATS